MPLTDYSTLIGGDWGIYQTAAKIKGLIYDALHDPDSRIRLRAESLLVNSPERDDLSEITSIFTWVQDHFHYVNDPLGIELVKTPPYIDQEIDAKGEFMGDCDDVSGYLAALLVSVGYSAALVVVSPTRAPSYDYRHIYVRVWNPGTHVWIGLDATARFKPMGWEVPNKKERMYVV